MLSDLTYYQFDNQLNVIREVNLNDYMPSPDMVYLDISRDGSEIYTVEHSLMRRINLDSSDEQILLETKMGFDMDLNSIGSLRLIDNGKTVLFSGDKFLSVEEGGSHINTVRVYGSMSPDGENRVGEHHGRAVLSQHARRGRQIGRASCRERV